MKNQITFISLFLISIFLVACSSSDQIQPSDTGQGGSLARFAIVGNYLYVVDNTDINVFDITNPLENQFIYKKEIGIGIETIFPFKDRLFIGSEHGMYTYSIQSNGIPEQQSLFQHIESCDPVVANDSFAYVTLRTGNDCRFGVGENRLDVLDITNLDNPILINSYSFENPAGMALDGGLLFLCDLNSGLHLLDVNDPYDVQKILTLDISSPLDAIALNGLLLVITPISVIEIDYSNLGEIKILSTITTDG
jgi:hypothetical protein